MNVVQTLGPGLWERMVVLDEYTHCNNNVHLTAMYAKT